MNSSFAYWLSLLRDLRAALPVYQTFCGIIAHKLQNSLAKSDLTHLFHKKPWDIPNILVPCCLGTLPGQRETLFNYENITFKKPNSYLAEVISNASCNYIEQGALAADRIQWRSDRIKFKRMVAES